MSTSSWRCSCRAASAAKQSRGYVCLSLDGSVLEANLRAYHLVEQYRDAAGIVGHRGALTAFAARAREQARGGQPWQIATSRPPSVLQVDVLQLVDATRAVAGDIILLEMREVTPPPLSPEATRARASLTPTELKVALLFACTGASNEELAKQLSISEGTVRSHMQDIRKRLGATTRGEIAARILC
jgi:DNA-binding CsgD family transcriptional regulator